MIGKCNVHGCTNKNPHRHMFDVEQEAKTKTSAARSLDGILLPGWDCPSCQVFNGEAKEPLECCRHCATPKPSNLDQAFAALQKTHKQALANLTEVQTRCTELVLENRALRTKVDALLMSDRSWLRHAEAKEEEIRKLKAEAAVFEGRHFR
jgi:hypothetical protein